MEIDTAVPVTPEQQRANLDEVLDQLEGNTITVKYGMALGAYNAFSSVKDEPQYHMSFIDAENKLRALFGDEFDVAVEAFRGVLAKLD